MQYKDIWLKSFMIQLTFIVIILGKVKELESQNPSPGVGNTESTLANSSLPLGPTQSNISGNADQFSLLDILNIHTNNSVSRKRRDLIENPLSAICSRVAHSTTPPLLCYQCKSNNPKGECDTLNWDLLSKEQRIKLRLRCPVEIGAFCVKKVQETSNKRITERGCYGPGPETTLDGNVIHLKVGCVTYHQNGFKTRSCLCDSDLCNSGQKLNFRINILVMTVLILKL